MINKRKYIKIHEIEVLGGPISCTYLRYHQDGWKVALINWDEGGDYWHVLKPLGVSELSNLWILEFSYFTTSHPKPSRLI